jgi:outer membrane murein-binding lipoprotein Lpp
MKQILLSGLVLAGLAILGLVLAGCESPAAQRERAQAERIRAEAEAYQVRLQADVDAAAERANVRQMERDAAHQRALETLPYLVAIGGGILVLVLAGLVFWDLRGSGPPGRRAVATTDPALLLLLERQRLEQAQLWHAIAWLDRRSLSAGEHGREVIVYTDRQQ